MMIKTNSNIGTLGAEIKDGKMLTNENIVKVTTEKKLSSKSSSLAISFKRNHIFESNVILHKRQ